MNISLAPETVFHLGQYSITNSIFTGWLVTLFLLITAFVVGRNLKAIPGRVQALFESAYELFYNLALGIIGNEQVTREIIPYCFTLFFFILFSNWSGLIPGFNTIGFHEVLEGKEVLVPLFRAPTTDLNLVIGLALISMGYVQYLGIKYSGLMTHIGHFINFKSPIDFFIGILELVGEFSRIISFTFRLFGNIFAGEVLLSVMFFLTMTFMPYIAIIPLPFYFLEFFVGIIQAIIFPFLTIIFVSLAVSSHGGEEHHTQPELAIHS